MATALEGKMPESLSDGHAVRIDLNTAHALNNLGVGSMKGGESASVEYQFQGKSAGQAEENDARAGAMTDWERTPKFLEFAKSHLREFNRIFRVDSRHQREGALTSVRGSGYSIAQGNGVTTLMTHGIAGTNPDAGVVEAGQDALSLPTFHRPVGPEK